MEEVRQGDLNQIWGQTGLLRIMAERHRTQKRNGKPTDYQIEELRNDHYGGWTNSDYFTRAIQKLATIHPNEVQVENNNVRIRRQGILNYKSVNDNFQMDFELPS